MQENQHPPKLAFNLLKLFCREEYFEEVAGDLEEVYKWRLANGSLKTANFKYYLDSISAIRFYKIGQLSFFITNAMLFSFIKSSFRNFKRHKGYTSINIFGLALGMTAALFILQYVSVELNYNRSSNSEQIYRVSNDYYRFGEMVYESSMTFSGVGPAMERDLPDVVEYARLFSPDNSRGGDVILTRPDNTNINFIESAVFFSDPDYLNFFDLEIISGFNELESPNRVLITEEIARKYFGSIENAVGNSILYNDVEENFELVVTGIFKKPEFNLQIDSDILISYSTLGQQNPEYFIDDWGRNTFITFVQIEDNSNPRRIERMMDELTLRYKPSYAELNEEGGYLRVNRYFLTGITDIHLNSNYQNEIGPIGDANTINILQIIALFIVLIAWINFINLSTAKSIERAREVGVRKSMGAKKIELVSQFFTEAVLINSLALLLALVFVAIGQPFFNIFVEQELSLQSIDFSQFGYLGIIIFIVGTGLSGFYPALVISSHEVIDALKGRSKVDSSQYLRRGLIVFQLLFSSLLIIATIAISEQINFMNNQEMGFDMEQVVILRGPVISELNDEENTSLINTFIQEVSSIPGVKNVGTTTVIPGQGILRGMAISRVRESELDMKSIERVVTSNNFLTTMNMRFLAGEDFNENMNGYTPLIINNSASKMLGFGSPKEAIGEVLFEFTREERIIVGVIEDYHHESLNRRIDPMYFVRNEAIDTFYAISLETAETAMILESINDKYEEIFPGNPVEYQFLDQFYGMQYKKDEVNLKVFGSFAIIAIIVACLGLLGLSSYSTVQRTKEVGVRKVLGASIPSIFILLSKELFLLVIIGFTISTPFAFLGIRNWLNDFAYQMTISLDLFIWPLILILTVTLCATCYTILKVTLSNPIESLSYE